MKEKFVVALAATYVLSVFPVPAFAFASPQDHGQTATVYKFSEGRGHKTSTRKPDLLLINGDYVQQVQQDVKSGNDAAYLPALDQLRSDADQALKESPFSVMYKKLPPQVEISMITTVYPPIWPDPSKSDGLPYILKDGQTNPQYYSSDYDEESFVELNSDVNTLALAYYLTGNNAYGKHAAELLQTWFLDPNTRMNPNLNYGQSVPGLEDGRKEGLISTDIELLNLADDVQLLKGSKYWSDQDTKGFLNWEKQFLKWETDSKLGQEEQMSTNNHGTWYDVSYVGLQS